MESYYFSINFLKLHSVKSSIRKDIIEIDIIQHSIFQIFKVLKNGNRNKKYNVNNVFQ